MALAMSNKPIIINMPSATAEKYPLSILDLLTLNNTSFSL